jgi:hypothetical protein
VRRFFLWVRFLCFLLPYLFFFLVWVGAHAVVGLIAGAIVGVGGELICAPFPQLLYPSWLPRGLFWMPSLPLWAGAALGFLVGVAIGVRRCLRWWVGEVRRELFLDAVGRASQQHFRSREGPEK